MANQGITFTVNAETAAAAAKLTEFFNGVSKNLEAIGKMGEVFDGIGSKLEAIASAAALVEFSRDAIQAGRSLAQLNEVIKSTGQASAEFSDQLEQQRTALSKATGVAEDEIVTSQRLLLSFGAHRDEMEKLTPLTLDYATALGTTATAAAEQLGRALSGQGIVLRGMRVEIDQTLPKAQQLAVLMEILSQRVGGQARAAFEAAAPDVERFNLQLKETEKAIGNVFLRDFAGPFLSGFGVGLERLESQLKQFDASFPALASAIKSIAGGLGDLAGKIAPAIGGLGLLVLSVQAAKFGFSSLVSVLDLVRGGITLLGSESMLPMLGWIAAATTALYAGVEAWRAWNAASEAKKSAVAAAAADEDLRSTIVGNIGSSTKSGAITQDSAHSLEAQVNALDRAGLSADEYHKRLIKIATDLRHLVAPEGSAINVQEDLFNKKIAELQKSYEASSAAAKSHGALGAAALDEAKNEQQYNRGLISLEAYLQKRRNLLTQQATEEQIPIQKAIEVTTDALIKLRNQLEQVEGTTNYTELARLTAELDKLKLQKEKLETDLQVSTQNAGKRNLEQGNLEFQNPTTVEGGIQLGSNDALKQMGTTYQDIGKIISTAILTPISAVSKGITGLIMGTLTWHQAIKQIGQSIITDVVQSIVEMGVKWVSTHVLMRAASEATAALMTVLGVQQKADNAGTLATGAAAGVGTSGAEGGWVGILIYLGVLAAALGAVAGLTGGFSDGGFTGIGAINKPAGVVHGQEFVLRAPAVQQLGLGNLNYMNRHGTLPTSTSVSSHSHINLVTMPDMTAARAWAKSAEGETHIVDTVRRNIHLIQKG